MATEITLRDGLRVVIDGRPPQGSRHEICFGVLPATGEAVVVKLERVGGAVAREGAALRHLAARGVPVPEVRAIGLADDAAMGGVPCLVSTRREGAAPTSRDGWRRMGRALGRLAEPVSHVEDLAVLDHRRFGQMHEQRVAELGDCLAALAAEVPDWPALAGGEIPQPGPLVVTHGDPGPGNFLDDGRDGWLIDWEEAQIAPRGLDLARLVCIAWLGSGPAGFVGRDHAARARAAVSGYLDAVPGGWHPTRAEARWWLAVAGVQFVHHRRRSAGRPGRWEVAVEMLRHRLTETVDWS